MWPVNTKYRQQSIQAVQQNEYKNMKYKNKKKTLKIKQLQSINCNNPEQQHL